MFDRLLKHRRSSRRAALSLCLSLLLFMTSILSAMGLRAEAAPVSPPDDAAVGAVLLVNLENNLTLYEKNADEVIYPASAVKLMTGYLTCSALSGRLDETVTVTSAMLAGVSGRRLHLADGEKLTVRDLLYAAICGSYNDAAAALAYLVSGSVSAFVTDMNREATRLGLKNTVYTNPTGLHDPAMVTTAREVLVVAREAYANSLYRAISSTRTYTIPTTNVSEERLIQNRNALISDSSRNYYNGYCRGLNAGMTDEGGWCVVTVCERGGAENLSVVMQGQDPEGDALIPAYTYTNALHTWANTAYGYRMLFAAGDVYATRSVSMTGVSRSKADLVLLDDLTAYLPADADVDALRITSTQEGTLTAPLKAGEVVGSLTVSYEGRVVGRADLIVTEDYQRNGFLDAMMAFRGYLTSRPFLLAIVVFLALALPFLRATATRGGRYSVHSARRRKIKYHRRRY